MPVRIAFPLLEAVLEADRLSQDTFSPFGTVIENPDRSLVPSPRMREVPPNATQANQGSALKYLDVTQMRNMYDLGTPSKKAAKAVMNMFICAPRTLLPPHGPHINGLFPVEILERHPYTTQTFIPLGLSQSEADQARYLVIVAPSLDPSPADEGFPTPSDLAGGDQLPGRGLPDLTKVKAFIAYGSQAVTYGAGTWQVNRLPLSTLFYAYPVLHAPMVVVGKKPIDFVVVQFANGIAIEDCQEAELETGGGGRLLVEIPTIGLQDDRRLFRL
ncbi:RmlC-like cupin [Venustampulla echinocandica]|uniref:RmlC-like cupin n=1 Tax=Venustampulla echinocandica TaxID=2656787 RepID=A0A370TXY3_9HELO|nr:RmlC-like cupin [Venustampulla echinocandica]RDL40382.1 RmlC-like cupin [Venustampulla echinocandica]